MDVEARTRAIEDAWLVPRAARSYPARRLRPEPDHPFRTPFMRDRDRIVHAKAFRRLKHKTQVFIAPEGDHFRTRMTHTLEVTQISRIVARALGLNEDLTEAIGMGHDLGHPPFGHLGEEALDLCLRERFGRGFRHFAHSLRVVDVLEPLNLCAETRDGILCHSGRAPQPATQEGAIVRLVDRIAYLNHDIDDAVRAGVLDERALPAGPIGVLGTTGRKRIDAMVRDLVAASLEHGSVIAQGDEAAAAMDELRTWMFDEVYIGEAARREHARVHGVIRALFEHYVGAPEAMADRGGARDADLGQRVVDWVAGMTDRFALRTFEALVVPRGLAS